MSQSIRLTCLDVTECQCAAVIDNINEMILIAYNTHNELCGHNLNV